MAATLKKVKKETPNPSQERATVYLPDRDAIVAERAYHKAESRGFAPGHELDDWLDAEQEFLQ